jgi:hypothetical protein
MTRIIAALTLAGALLTMACHNNKPAQNPAQTQPAAPAPVQGPPP